MSASDYRVALVDYIRAQARPIDKFSHQVRLYELARLVGAGLDYDDDIVFATAWLHDLGVFVGHRPEELSALASWDMIGYAVQCAPDLLRRFSFPEAKIPAVLEAIRQHQPTGNPTSLEGIIVRDADILEQLGAVGILRTASKLGRDTRFLKFPDVLKVLQANLDHLPGQLRLPSARELAKPKLAALKTFLQAAAAEGCLQND